MSPKCPYCNEELKYTELRRSQNEGDYYFETWEGRCPKCLKDFYGIKYIPFHIVTI